MFQRYLPTPQLSEGSQNKDDSVKSNVAIDNGLLIEFANKHADYFHNKAQPAVMIKTSHVKQVYITQCNRVT